MSHALETGQDIKLERMVAQQAQNTMYSITVNVNTVDADEKVVSQRTIQQFLGDVDCFGDLEKKVLQELKLPPSTPVLSSYNGQIVTRTRTPLSVSMTNPAVMELAISSIQLGGRSGGPAKDIGKKIVLTLRDNEGKKQDVKTGEKEPFKDIIEKYCKAVAKVTVVSVTLLVDGEKVRHNQTPLDFNLEDEDIVDVKVG